LCLGGGGRYLIFHLPKARKLAVFDVSEARIIKYLPLTEDKIFFAAGLEKLVVALPAKGVIERWSLTSFEREVAIAAPFNQQIKMVMLGHGSNGPVIVNNTILDLSTLKPLPNTFEGGGWDPSDMAARRVASADGSTYGIWGNNGTTFVLEGGITK